MENRYLTKKARRELERRTYIRNLYQQLRDERLQHNLDLSALRRSALQAQRTSDKRNAQTDSERRKWRDALLDDKNYTRLKRILSGIGYNDAIQDVSHTNALGEETFSVNPAVLRIAGALGKLPNLSPENVYVNTARIARLELPDFYDSEKIKNMILPIASEVSPKNAIAIVNSFSKDPNLLADFQVAKGIMPNSEALLYAINQQKIRKESQNPPNIERSGREIPEEMVQNAVRNWRNQNPGQTISERSALNFPEVAKTDPQKYRELFLRTPAMSSYMRRKAQEKRQDEDALGMSDALFRKIKAQTEAANRERQELGEDRYLLALNEYRKNNPNVSELSREENETDESFRNRLLELGTQLGNQPGAPKYREYMVNAMNLGRTIPNTDPNYQYYTPNAAGLSRNRKYFYTSPEFWPGVQNTTPREVRGLPSVPNEIHTEEASKTPKVVQKDSVGQVQKPANMTSPENLHIQPYNPVASLFETYTPYIVPTLVKLGNYMSATKNIPARQTNEADVAERQRLSNLWEQKVLSERRNAIEAEKRRIAEEDRKNAMNLYLTGGF